MAEQEWSESPDGQAALEQSERDYIDEQQRHEEAMRQEAEAAEEDFLCRGESGQ